MASKLNPWRSLQTLAIRTTRPAARRPQIQSAALITRRYLTHDTYNNNNHNTQPPIDGPGRKPSEEELAGEVSEGVSEYVPKPIEPFADNYVNAEAIAALEEEAAGNAIAKLYEDGLKYHMPESPVKHEQLQDRHHPVIHQVTRMLMRDGKLSKAEKHVSLILNYLRTSPPPKISPLRPLLPGSPPAVQLPLNPVAYLIVAIDSVAPLIRVRNLAGLAGGGHALEVPEPMAIRQRRRQALLWILDIVNKKRSVGSGKKQFAARFGSEIVAVVEGRSSVWDRRNIVHKLGTSARANLAHPALKGKRKKGF